MRTSILLTLATLILSVAGAFGQAGLREKDPDAYKFIGTWAYEANGERFSVTFWAEYLPIGSKDNGDPLTIEVLTGVWKARSNYGEVNAQQEAAVMANTMKKPNVLEGSINDRSYGKRYYFTLEYTGSDEAVWKVVREQKIGNPKAGAIPIAPPTECVMKKVE